MGASKIYIILCALLIISVICSDGLRDSHYNNLQALRAILRSRSYEDDGDFKRFLKHAGVKLPGYPVYMNRYGIKQGNVDRYQDVETPKIYSDIATNNKLIPYPVQVEKSKMDGKRAHGVRKLRKEKFRPFRSEGDKSDRIIKHHYGKKGKKKLLLKIKRVKKKNQLLDGNQVVNDRFQKNNKMNPKKKQKEPKLKKGHTVMRSGAKEIIKPDLLYPDPPIIIIEKEIPLETLNPNPYSQVQSLETYNKADHDKFLKKIKKKNQPHQNILDLNGHDNTREMLEDYMELKHQTKDDPIVILNGKTYKVNVGNVKTRDRLTPYFKNVRLVKRVVPVGRSHNNIEYNPQMKGYYKPLMKLSNPESALLDINRKLADDKDNKKRRDSASDPYFSLYSTNGFQEPTKPTTKAQKFNYWNYWSYKKTIYQDNCPHNQALHNGICVRLPEHRKRHVMDRVKYINRST